jgi:2-amino-4-hydroxy-6-hydroxymethyldihydropteridine diphosphokinase
MAIVYILLGSNLNNKISQLNTALQNIIAQGLNVKACSSVYQTKAWGNTNQDDFLNVVLKAQTNLNASDLLETLLNIELQMGRIRGQEKWMPRLIDIDILYYEEEIIQLPNLILPHLYIQQRRFTLIPLNEVAPHYVHPILKLTNAKLLELCEDESDVIKTDHTLNF